MLKHIVIISTLIGVTAAACQQDKATPPASAPPIAPATTAAAGQLPLPRATGDLPMDAASGAAVPSAAPGALPDGTAPQTEHEVQAASLAVSRARGDFLAVADVRLNELDKKLATMKKDRASKRDWAEIDRLRAETESLRTAIKSNARLYTLAVQKEFEALVSTIDERLR